MLGNIMPLAARGAFEKLPLDPAKLFINKKFLSNFFKKLAAGGINNSKR